MPDQNLPDLNYHLCFGTSDTIQVAIAQALKGRIRKNAKVLDIGANAGLFLQILGPDYKNSAGVDASIQQVKAAQDKGLFVLHAWAESLPFPNAEFEYAVLSCMLEQCADPIVVLKEAERVGRIVCGLIPGPASPWAVPGHNLTRSSPPYQYLQDVGAYTEPLVIQGCELLYFEYGVSAFATPKVVVYTVASNCYEVLKQPKDVSPYARYACFTDTVMEPVEPYEYLPLYHVYSEHHKNVRVPKILPHVFFPDADVFIYHDGSMQLTATPEDILEFMLPEYQDDAAFFAHPGRVCVYREIDICIREKIGDPDKLEKFKTVLEQLGVAKASGLWAGGFSVRRNNMRVQRFNEIWWDLYSLKEAERDQVALAAALTASGCTENHKMKLRTPEGCVYKNQFTVNYRHGEGPAEQEQFIPRLKSMHQKLESVLGVRLPVRY